MRNVGVVVLAMVLLTVIVLFPPLGHPESDYRSKATKAMLAGVKTALSCYCVDCGRYPDQSNGLAALRVNPGEPTWRGPYLEAERLTDGWGGEPRYVVSNLCVWVVSAGSDGIFDTADDIRVDAHM